MALGSINPYLFRGILDWFYDNDQTPLLVINTNDPGVDLPESVKNTEDNYIYLVISETAVAEFEVQERGIDFMTKFSGQATHVYIPYSAMMELRSRESNVSYPLFILLPDDKGLEDDEAIFEKDEGDDEPLFTLVDKDKK